MALFKNSLIGRLIRLRKEEREIHGDIRKELVHSLFEPLMSLVTGVVAAAIACLIAISHSASTSIIVMTFITVIIGSVRIAISCIYLALFQTRDLKIRFWEKAYELGAWSFSASYGYLTFLTTSKGTDPFILYIVGVSVMGYAAVITARNAGRPHIAFGQVALALGPMALGHIINNEGLYRFLGVAVLFSIVSMTEVTLSIRNRIVSAIIVQREKAQLAERFKAALDNMSHGLVMFDGFQRLDVSNQRFAEMAGIPMTDLEDGTPAEWIIKSAFGRDDEPKAIENFMGHLNAGESIETTIRTPNDRIIDVNFNPGVRGSMVVSFEDNTEQRKAEARIAHMARYDGLTDLPNRTFAEEHLQKLFTETALDPYKKFAVMFIDLDRFKIVNDSLGHPMGDALLKDVAERLAGMVRPTDIVARFGGDEFVVIQSPLKDTSSAQLLAQRIIDELRRPYDIKGQRIDVGASVGIALSGQHGDTTNGIIKNADIALYEAKTNGRNRFFLFEENMESAAKARQILEVDLRQAVDRNEFELHYQPIADINTGETVICEALVRWRHPVRGLVPPNDFIPIAEETGLIVQIGRWVLQQACRDAKTWPEHVRVAVNLSPVQFADPELIPTVRNATSDAGIVPGRLEIEIVETVMMNDSEATIRVMHELREVGVTISLDDFGSGYSALSYLHRFKFEKIKIDGSYARTIQSQASAAIIKAIATIGVDLDMRTVIEGVETTEQLNTARRLGCTEVQGWLLAKAMPNEALLAHFEPSRIIERAEKFRTLTDESEQRIATAA